jgi:3-hydroxyisobutyrate dehydrogenase-like beta-hydroxyacid dehydrogenase
VKIAFLGLGKMGLPVARRLWQAGHDLIAWNRSPKTQEILAGLPTSSSAGEAVDDRDLVFTMLNDDEAVKEVVLGDDGVAQAMAAGSTHVSLSTISVALSERLTSDHLSRGQRFVAAPVFGRPNVAADGKLWIALAADEAAIEIVRPLLASISRGYTVVGSEPRQAHALKLGGNFMITAMVQALSEAFVFADAQGIDPRVFLETVNSALFQSPFYAAYGKVMLEPPEHPGATVALGIKDTRLLRESAKAVGRHLPLADHLAGMLRVAAESGMLREDWAVGQYRTAQFVAKSADHANSQFDNLEDLEKS